MSVYKSLSKEQRKQLLSLYNEESMKLLKRPMYCIGNFVIAAMIFYFLFTGLGYTVSQLPMVSDILGSIIGLAVVLLVIWLINKWLKLKKNNILFFIFWGIWMFIWFLLKSTHVGPKVISYEYLIYAVLVFVSWLCCGDSMLKYFCNKIFIAENNKQTQDQKAP